jgi:hypothetical protein
MKIEFRNWDFMRIIRLLFGILGMVAFAMSGELIYAMIGSVMLIQVVFNMGCSGGACGYPQYKRTKDNHTDHVVFEEIK